MVGRGMVNRGSMAGRGRMNGGSMVGRGMVNRGSMVGRGMMNRGSMVGRSMVNSVVCWRMGRVVSTNIGRGVRGGDGSGSNHSSGVFFRVVIAMYSLGSSMGLTSHCSGIGTMGLVN